MQHASTASCEPVASIVKRSVYKADTDLALVSAPRRDSTRAMIEAGLFIKCLTLSNTKCKVGRH